MSENLYVGTHKTQNEAWDKGYDQVNWQDKDYLDEEDKFVLEQFENE